MKKLILLLFIFGCAENQIKSPIPHMCEQMNVCAKSMEHHPDDFMISCNKILSKTDDERNISYNNDCNNLPPCSYMACVITHINVRGAIEKINSNGK